MSKQRDELAQIIGAAFEDVVEDLTDVSWADVQHGFENQTDEILAAGYRKPRTVTTAEELDALPEESGVALIWDDGTNAVILQKEDGYWWPTKDSRGYTSAMLWDQRAGATLTVLHVGGQS